MRQIDTNMSDSFSHTTPQFQPRHQPSSSVRSTYQGWKDLNNYILHLHAACFHRYQPETDPTPQAIQLGTQLIGGDNLSAPILLACHPRWCPSCSNNRARTLKVNTLKRLDSLIVRYSELGIETEENQAKLRREYAYLAGVFRGRTHALFTPLEQNENFGFIDELGGNVDLSSVLDSLTIGRNGDEVTSSNAGNDVTEDLLDLIDRMEITRDEIGHEARLVFSEWDENQLGFDDGRCLQAAAERAGVAEFNEEKRKQILDGALL